MNFLIYILMLFVIFCFVFIWYISSFNKFQDFIIRINEAENNIDSILRKRFDLLSKASSIINTLIDKEDALESISKLRSQKLTNFELDRKLCEAINELNIYRNNIEDLGTNEAFIKIEIGLNESEIEITAFRKYYNDIITDYNKAIKTFPSLIVAKTCKYKERTYFDGKDMFDNIINDFKL